jgi:hypothetical protein
VKLAKKSRILLPAFLLVLAAPCPAQIRDFSTGRYGTPETISLVPAGFGPYGGFYFIPDARLSVVWVVRPLGGEPTPFPASPQGVRGGLFLPPGWGGPDAGLFLTAGTNVNVYDNLGSGTSFQFLDPVTGLPVTATATFTMPLIAPSGFGGFAGYLFVSDQNNKIWAAAPGTKMLTVFRFLPDSCPSSGFCAFRNFLPFGLELAPPAWGPGGNMLLVSDGSPAVDDAGVPLLDQNGQRYSTIVAVGPDGGVIPFADIPLRGAATDPDIQQQNGLRQMLVLPDDFLVPSLGAAGAGKLLLVSVAGSGNGGGVLGETLAVNASGQIKGHLVTGSVTAKFDPRGMTVTADNHVLISDTSDPIWSASATDFAPGRGAVCSVMSSASASSLWPPNHDLVNVGLSVTSSCPSAVTVSVYSDEDELADDGDGAFSPDAADIAVGTLRLRSERSGTGEGRVYLIVAGATDIAGTAAASCSTVVVPHSKSSKDVAAVAARASAASQFCSMHQGTAPEGFSPVGNGPVVPPKQ